MSRLPTDATPAAQAAQIVRPAQIPDSERPSWGVLSAISVTHLINDMMQSVLLALYPVLQGNFDLSFVQVGLITVAYQFSASLLQPLVGRITDKKPMPYSLPVGMGFTLVGLLLLSQAPSYAMVLFAALLVGTGSSVFHPESSRVARMASAGQHGLAQAIFQVGGTAGSSVGALLAAAFIAPLGQPSVAWVALAALAGILILNGVSRWYAQNLNSARGKKSLGAWETGLSRQDVRRAMGLLMVLVFSKFVYLTSLNSYYTFYLIDHFGVSVQNAQYALFIFLVGGALGTLVGGPIGDRIGRKRIILGSILGSAPFALLLPFVSLPVTVVLAFFIGAVLSSAFPSMIVYGQELMPGKTGTVSGLFYGLAFGIAGIGAAAIGALADVWDIELVYHLCAYLPLLGFVAFFLPDVRSPE